MTTLCSRAISLRSRFILCLAAGALSLLFGAYDARSASAFTSATNCALPGSNFQGGDGDQTAPTLAEQTFCTEHFLPTTTDWQNVANVVNSPDAQEPAYGRKSRRAAISSLTPRTPGQPGCAENARRWVSASTSSYPSHY